MTKFAVISAFSEKPEGGNQAAVCLLDRFPTDQEMLSSARRLGFSETAFLVPASGRFLLRWFSPVREVDLCGHATLASAFYLWSRGILSPEEQARFETRSGILGARLEGEAIFMDFPADQVKPAPLEPVLETLLAGHFVFAGQTAFDYFIEVDSPEFVKFFAPAPGIAEQLPGRGFIVTARGTGPFDFVSRFFAPKYGIPEDPVTGSAHCALGTYWGKKLEKTTMLASQLSARGGSLQVTVSGTRVILGGKACLSAEIEF